MKNFLGTIKVTAEFEIDISAESETEANEVLNHICSVSYVTPSTTNHKSWLDLKHVRNYTENHCDVEIEWEAEETK